MPKLKSRLLLPACLMLGALFCTLPAARADAPDASSTVETHWQKLVLQHTVPSDILKALPWNNGTDLPTGVTRIYGVARENALVVEATPDGFVHLRDIVKGLDVDPGQVQIKMTLARATPADMSASGVKFTLFPSPESPTTLMGDATGPAVARFAQTLKAQGAVLQSPTIMTSNRVEASVNLSSDQPMSALSGATAVTFGVTPRTNSDGSLTLVLDPQATWRVAGKTNPDGTPTTETRGLLTLRTIANGDTLVISNLFPGTAGADGSQLLLFVTPTTGGGNTASATVQPSKP